MRRRNRKRTTADKISCRAEHLKPVRGVVGDSAAVLLVLGVPEEDGADDFVAHGGGEVADCGGGEGGALAVGWG